MALYDNKYWILSHIRNSFMASDDTGVSENIMTPERRKLKETFFDKEPYPDPDLSDDEDEDDDDAGSFDIQIGGGNYQLLDRSITQAELEKMEYHYRKAANTKHVKWELRHSSDDDVDISDLFVQKPVSGSLVKEEKSIKSALSTLIKHSVNVPVNRYIEYARFDGSGQMKHIIKKYHIYITMLPESERNYPLPVCCDATAKVHELIGLILLKVSTTYKGDYDLKPVEYYGLYITEDDGEVDSDFPPLEPTEYIAKFHFCTLGLVEHKKAFDLSAVPQRSLSSPDSDGKKRTTSASKKEGEHQEEINMRMIAEHNTAMEAPLYKSYKVHLINKVWWWNIEVHLGISGEKMEIDPINQKNQKFQLVKLAPVSHPIESLAWCEETESRGNRTSFKVIYSSSFGAYNSEGAYLYSQPTSQKNSSFKHYDFEADKDVAKEIMHKIKLILDLRFTQSKKDYFAAKERKRLNKKKKGFKYFKF